MSGIKLKTCDASLKALIFGMQLGNVFFANGSSGDDNATGVDQQHAVKTPNAAMLKTVSANHDHILMFGTFTQVASLAIASSHVSIIGIGGGGMKNEAGRGAVWTCLATDDSIIPATTADYLEIAGILFNQSATDHILIDDAGATDGFFHDNTIFGSTTASDAVRLDLEGARWTINDNIFTLCKLSIDVAAAMCVIKRNVITDVDIAAKGVVIGASAHYCIVEGNDFNLSGGSGDIGITIASSADSTLVKDNTFDDGISDCISDAGTATNFVNNIQSGLTGTSGSSLALIVEN